MIENYANKLTSEEYNLFMTVMHVSVSKHLFDEHFTVIWANDYFYQLIGYEKEEYTNLFHNHVDEYYRDDPDSIAWMGKAITEAYEKNEPGYEFDCPMKVKDGGRKWIRVTGRFTDEKYNGIPVIYTIYTDITNLKDLQMKLCNALKEAQQANRAKSEFLSRMSHDIRTPINAIIGMTEIASDHIEDSSRVRDCLKKITLSSHHLLGLINDVLDMSKIESGKMTLNHESVSLPDVLENIVTIMQPEIERKKQKFSVRLHNVQHECFLSDSLRLRQILINLLSNASKFTPDGGSVVFEVREVTTKEQSIAGIRFIISDTGIGMKPEFLKHIFDTFTREQDSRIDSIEGSGLGMAITKKLVDIFQGTIEVDSTIGKGTTFCVTLPLEIGKHMEICKTCQNKRALVVDDDEMACESIVHSLQELGVYADWAGNGRDAIEQLIKADEAQGGYDIAILDWKMPGLDAIQITKEIRKRVGEKLPVLVVSAYDWSYVEEEARKIGVSGFLQKPIFKSNLSFELQRCLSGNLHEIKKVQKQDFNGKRFLLVEDNELNREIAVELLASAGAIMETACDGVKGLEMFRQSPEFYYDMILMDIQMPRMNGYEVTRTIRSLLRSDAADIPILAMTADAFVEDIELAKASGMNSHISKPLNREKMVHEIGKFLK